MATLGASAFRPRANVGCRRIGEQTSGTPLLTGASLIALATPVAAQQTVSEIDEVVVTGIRLPNRTVTTSPAPIDVLTLEDLSRGGHSGTARDLQSLVPLAPAIVLGGDSAPAAPAPDQPFEREVVGAGADRVGPAAEGRAPLARAGDGVP